MYLVLCKCWDSEMGEIMVPALKELAMAWGLVSAKHPEGGAEGSPFPSKALGYLGLSARTLALPVVEEKWLNKVTPLPPRPPPHWLYLSHCELRLGRRACPSVWSLPVCLGNT